VLVKYAKSACDGDFRTTAIPRRDSQERRGVPALAALDGPASVPGRRSATKVTPGVLEAACPDGQAAEHHAHFGRLREPSLVLEGLGCVSQRIERVLVSGLWDWRR
jgi:hypothetical protein